MEISGFVMSVLRCALPVLLVAMGVLLNQKSGITQIGAEGFMLFGALFGVAGVGICGGYFSGFLMAFAIPFVLGLLFGAIVYILKVNDIVLGIAFNVFAAGLCALLYRSGVGAVRHDSGHFSFGWMIAVSVLICLLLYVFLYHMPQGLKLRTVGEYGHVGEALGLGGMRLRLCACAIGCGLMGIGGAVLSLGQLNVFVEDMTDGRGYIALAAVCFGGFKPIGTILAVLIFGCGEAVMYRLQAVGGNVPHQFILMIPYILTILGLLVAKMRRNRFA